MTLKHNLAIFRSLRPWIDKDSHSVPSNAQSVIPKWYKDADRFAKDPNGKYYSAPKEVCPHPKEGTTNDYGKIPTWKACPAIMDVLTTGYVLKTPCDLEFFKDGSGIINVKASDPKYHDFCTRRPPMPQFEQPEGFYDMHFAWYSDWGMELPDGYSAIFVTPLNRFDLPFVNTSGIIDVDKVYTQD